MTRRAEKVMSEALDAQLALEMPRIYADSEKATRLFRIVAFGLTLRERQLAIGEIARLKPVRESQNKEKPMPVPENFNPRDLDPPSQNLRAADYKLDQRWKLTISDVNLEQMEGRDENEAPRNKLVLSFEGREKRLVLNSTNRGFLAARLGENPNAWTGAEIILHRTTTTFGNETVPALRIIDVRGGNTPAPEPLDDSVPF